MLLKPTLAPVKMIHMHPLGTHHVWHWWKLGIELQEPRVVFIKCNYFQCVSLLLGDKFLEKIPRNTKMLKNSVVPHWF